jgi:hypothetical protein
VRRDGLHFVQDILAVSGDHLPEQFLGPGHGLAGGTDQGAQKNGEHKKDGDERKGR